MARKASKEARLTRASHQSASALGLFYRAADELEAAAQAASDVADEAFVEAEALHKIEVAANTQAAESGAAAAKIRSFFA